MKLTKHMNQRCQDKGRKKIDLKDALDADENVADENRLLPAMNKIWPFLVSCFKSENQLVSVVLPHLVIFW